MKNIEVKIKTPVLRNYAMEMAKLFSQIRALSVSVPDAEKSQVIEDLSVIRSYSIKELKLSKKLVESRVVFPGDEAEEIEK